MSEQTFNAAAARNIATSVAPTAGASKMAAIKNTITTRANDGFNAAEISGTMLPEKSTITDYVLNELGKLGFKWSRQQGGSILISW